MYRGNRTVDHCNALVARAVVDLVGRGAGAGGPLRELEIGGGTGGTTAGVLAGLRGLGAAVEYVFTDVSPGPVARATFGALDGIALTWALGRAEQGALGRAARQLADVILRGLEA